MGMNTGQMGTASLALQAAGAGASMANSYYGAKMQRDALRAQAATAEINARIAELGAESTLNQGKQQVANLTMQAGQLKGAQRTAMAARGVDLGEGSAAEIQVTTDLMKDIDAQTAKANAVRSAWGQRMQATQFNNSARSARASASSISPAWAATTSLLGSASSVASSWYTMNKAGVFDSAPPAAASADAAPAAGGPW